MPLLGAISGGQKTPPNPPTIVSATDVGTGRAWGNGAVTVVLSAPTYTGKLPITSYTVTPSSGSASIGPATTKTLGGLASATNYTFTATASNDAGTSTAAGPTGAVFVTTVPDKPAAPSATAGNAQATVSWTAPSTGGKAISSYTVTSSPGSISANTTGTSVVVTGLTNGTAYTFTVVATNANGNSLASDPSPSVSPVNPKPVVTGGTLTSDATYYYRTFTTNGTLDISVAPLTADYLVLSGGGAGGYGYMQYSKVGNLFSGTGGGGGCGGVTYLTSQNLTTGSRAITIGAGGTGSKIQSVRQGSASSFNGYSPTGGGAGGGGSNGAAGGGGGGGFGSWNDNSTAGAGTGGAGNNGGFAGGNGFGDTGTQTGAGGGGGGLGAVGQAAYRWDSGTGFLYARGGNGGNGATYFGTVYGGGGGGGAFNFSNIPISTGGTGGGGNGASGQNTTPTAGTANRGAGGGGAMRSNNNGANGGSGIVVVRYTRAQVD